MQHQTPNPSSSPSDARGLSYVPPRTPVNAAPETAPLSPAERIEASRLKEVFDRAPSAIWVLEGPELKVVLANPSFRKLLGERSVRNRPAREALPDLAGQGFLELLDRVLETGEPFVGREMALRFGQRADGSVSEGAFDLALEPLRDPAGRISGVICHATEVTAMVRSREALVAARTTAERANHAKSDFVAGMSHDLRTPLTAIGGYASLVAEGVYGPVTSGQADAMGRIARANAHLLALIDDVLRFATIEAGGLSLEIESFPVGEILTAIGELIEPQVSGKQLSYDCGDVPSDLRVRADRERLTQVLLNLLANAIKFTDKGGVSVECEERDTEVRIRVRDTGRGIPAEMIPRIFDPFVQVESRGDRRGGVGLGLATSLSLSRAMGGELTVDSVVGEGSVFTLTLPHA